MSALDYWIYIINKHDADDNCIFYRRAYELWIDTWTPYTKKMGVENYTADHFQVQDSIICVFHKKECVGVQFFKHVNLDLPGADNLAGFTPWTEEGIEWLKNISSDLVLATNLCITPKFRGWVDGIRWKYAIAYFTVKEFYHHYPHIPLMVAAVRRSKNVHKAYQDMGSIPVEKRVPFDKFKSYVDLIYFTRDKLKPIIDKPYFSWDTVWNCPLTKYKPNPKFINPITNIDIPPQP